MKLSCLLAASVIIVSGIAPAGTCLAGNAGREIAIAPVRGALPEHEKLTFRVKWLGFHVGTITASINGIKEINGRRAYELEATVKTNRLLSNIYPINDRYLSYMDAEKLHTLRHEVYRREGRYKKDAITDFDQVSHKAYFRNILDGSRKTVEIPPDVQDPLSAAHYFRTINIETGKKIAYRVYNNEEVYDLFGVADKPKRIKITRSGMREAFRIQPYARLKGEVVKKGKASGYFSCDGKRVLLLVSVRAPLFTEVTGYLEKEE